MFAPIVSPLFPNGSKTSAMTSVATIFDSEPHFGEVRNTAELKRVLALPERDPDKVGELIAAPLTARLKTPQGTMALWPKQALALAEAADYEGAMVLLPVGEGKTLITYLLPAVLNAQLESVLIVRAALLQKTANDFLTLKKHWNAKSAHRIVTYETVSRDPDILNRLKPKLIIADECHKLKDPKAACTKRVYRYMKENPETTFVGLSGTVAQRSFKDYWHLMQWALPKGLQPLPYGFKEMETWTEALDSKMKVRRGLGALTVWGDDVPTVRKAYGEKLRKTPGIVTIQNPKVRASLTIELVELKIPAIEEALKEMRRTWATPGGEEFCEAVDLWRHAREIANGFYYKWDPEPPKEWLEARSEFMKFVRGKLQGSRKLDTMAQVCDAYADAFEVLEWKEIAPSFKLRTVAVPLEGQTALRDYVASWQSFNEGLVWVEHRAAGEWLHSQTPYPYFSKGGNSENPWFHIDEYKKPAIVSVKAIGEGFNLQRYSKNLVLNCLPLGSAWEQMIGRTHRQGQKADNVHVEVLITAEEQRAGFWQAVKDAHYVQDTTGQRQKLCYADIVEKEASWPTH